MAVTTGRPGVFVSETLIPLAQTPDVPGQAIAAFVGTHDRGPVGPTLVASWAQWRSLYGEFGSGNDLLPYAVYEYFANGGGQCYVVRAVPADAVQASVSLMDVQTDTPAPVLQLTAIAPGAAGNSIYVSITGTSTPSNGRFNLVIRSGSTTSTPVEQYQDVSLDPSDSRNLIALLGAQGGGSTYVRGTYLGPAAWSVDNTPAAQEVTPLTAGSDGTAAVDLAAATQLLESVDQLLMVNLPGVNDPTVMNTVISWAATNSDRFVIIDGPQAADNYADTVSAYKNLSPLGTSTGTPLATSSYAALYGPWISFRDPSSSASGATRLLPPGGAMLGLYAQADATAGVQQSAAGTAYRVQGAVSPQVRFTDADLDSLNVLGVNVIRAMPGATGLVPMGARTLASGMPDRYIAIRRTLMYLTRLCIQATNFAVFRPNNADLWNQLTSILTDQLSTLQQAQVLQGATAADAFYVLCNDTNNTANSIANGIVNIEVGVALNTPAEYVVIQIGQMAAGATSSDNLATAS